MEKKMENEMETGIISGIIAHADHARVASARHRNRMTKTGVCGGRSSLLKFCACRDRR